MAYLVSVQHVLQIKVNFSKHVMVVLGKGKKPNICGSMLYIILLGVFGCSVTLAPSTTNFQTSKFCGIRLGIWPLFGIKQIICLKEFPYQICQETRKLYFIDSFFLFVLVKRIPCPPIFLNISSLHLNKILLLSVCFLTWKVACIYVSAVQKEKM